jgi:hypothetical protein
MAENELAQGAQLDHRIGGQPPNKALQRLVSRVTARATAHGPRHAAHR